MATITTQLVDNMLFESRLGNHTVRIDVPPAMGGSDRGPTPPELFVASLGSCIAAFAAQYCQRVGLDTTDLEVAVHFEKADNRYTKRSQHSAKLPSRSTMPQRMLHRHRKFRSVCTLYYQMAISQTRLRFGSANGRNGLRRNLMRRVSPVDNCTADCTLV
jgi:uncharacterized OsmC-like protein